MLHAFDASGQFAETNLHNPISKFLGIPYLTFIHFMSNRKDILLGQWNRYKWHIFSVIAIATVALVSYYPSLDIGFWADDYMFFENAGRLPFGDYVLFVLDPNKFAKLFTASFRLQQPIQWKIEYLLFQDNGWAYHEVQVTLHVINCLILYAIVDHYTHRRQIALVSTLFYVSLTTYSYAVFWLAVGDPLSTIFFLLDIWLWSKYLESGKKILSLYAYAIFTLALVAKETNVALPFALVLVDWLLMAKPTTIVAFLRRYSPFFLTLMIYVLLQVIALTRGMGSFSNSDSFKELFDRVVYYLQLMAFPYEFDRRINTILLILIALVAIVYWLRGEKRLFFLIGVALLPLLPVLLLRQSNSVDPRYLYLSLMATAVGLGLVVDRLWNASRHWRHIWGLSLIMTVAMIVLYNSFLTTEAALAHSGLARGTRLEFRPIFRKYKEFPPDTLLYFIDPPMGTVFLSGFMFEHYGPNVSVRGNDIQNLAIRDHKSAIVFYRDDQKVWQDQVVTEKSDVGVVPSLPVRFGSFISLDEFDVANSAVKRGNAFIVLLKWRALKKMDRDYSVFVHVVDSGKIVAGNDQEILTGTGATSSWQADQVATDGVIVPIPDEILPGNYTFQIGVYYLPTLERILITNLNGQVVADHVEIEPADILK